MEKSMSNLFERVGSRRGFPRMESDPCYEVPPRKSSTFSSRPGKSAKATPRTIRSSWGRLRRRRRRRGLKLHSSEFPIGLSGAKNRDTYFVNQRPTQTTLRNRTSIKDRIWSRNCLESLRKARVLSMLAKRE